MKSWTSLAYLAVALGAVVCAAVQPGEAAALVEGAAHQSASLFDTRTPAQANP